MFALFKSVVFFLYHWSFQDFISRHQIFQPQSALVGTWHPAKFDPPQHPQKMPQNFLSTKISFVQSLIPGSFLPVAFYKASEKFHVTSVSQICYKVSQPWII